MIVSDFTEVVLIDEAIIELQSQLSDLYERRRSILRPASKNTPRRTNAQSIDFDSIDLNLDDSRPLKLAKTHTRK